MYSPSKRHLFLLLISCSYLTACNVNENARQQGITFEDTLDVFDPLSHVGPREDGTHIVATSQIINPVGVSVTFPGRPTDLALDHGEKILAVKNNNSIVFIEVSSQAIRQTLKLPGGGNTFTGLVWSSDDKKIWTTDTRGFLRSAVQGGEGTFDWKDEIALSGPPEEENTKSYPGGFYIDEEKGLAWVTLSRNNTVGIVNLTEGTLEEEIPVGIAPYTIVIHQNKAYVTNWGGRVPVEGDKTGPSSESQVVVDPKTGIASTGSVSVIDRETRKNIAEIPVHLHPGGMVLSPDGNRLYVANANSDLITVIDTRTDKEIKSFSSKPMEVLPFGSAPNALSIDPAGQTLYVANGGNNSLAVIDLKTDQVTGLIPTGWYPGSVIMNREGSKLFVANIKGIGGRNEEGHDGGYNSHDHMGSISIIPVPDPETLTKYTTQAAANMRLPKMGSTLNMGPLEEKIVPVPTRPGEKSVFKHVLYIIKENRTYDQIFGDMAQGNGDSSICQFGRVVTPNHHALAEQFVLLDNTYCNGVLSADGHQWAMEGYVTDYLEKSFGGFVRSYPYDGDDALAYASSGFIWDKVLEAGLTFRNYGEFVQAEITPNSATWTDIYNQYKNGTNEITIKSTTQLHTLEPYLCPTFVGFPGKVQDVYRAREFIRELHKFEESGKMPNFMLMLLPNDHTVGTREGFPTPRATVADNDLAMGQIVEAVSHSKFWKETAIFVIQDDPQAGLDHVDGRRTVAFSISPYTKRGEVISTHYNQNSVLRTIELIFGLTPMSQFDLIAEPMTDCFTDQPDFTPYSVLPNQIPLDEMNPSLTALKGKQLHFAKKSMEMPLDDIDEADEDLLNRIIWHSVKGYNTPYPQLGD